MAYDERDERDMGLDEQGSLYEDSMYESETFAERLGDTGSEDETVEAEDLEAQEDVQAEPQTDRSGEGFGESLSPDEEAAEADELEESDETKDESVMDKA